VPDPTPPNRRAVHKARVRRAIVDAAADLMTGPDGVRFTVDQLAERADVSRRTVFNHFDTVDDVVAAVVAEAFADILDTLRRRAPTRDAAPRAAMRADLVGAVRAADLVPPMAALSRGLGLTGVPSESADRVPAQQAMLMLRSMSRIGDELTALLAERHPDVARIDVELDVAAAMSGLVVLHGHWVRAGHRGTDDAARSAWSTLVDRLSPSDPDH
jgi:TetR/AcrR family transcriptional regulator of autoinduction and epiphytic fitness